VVIDVLSDRCGGSARPRGLVAGELLLRAVALGVGLADLGAGLEDHLALATTQHQVVAGLARVRESVLDGLLLVALLARDLEAAVLVGALHALARHAAVRVQLELRLPVDHGAQRLVHRLAAQLEHVVARRGLGHDAVGLEDLKHRALFVVAGLLLIARRVAGDAGDREARAVLGQEALQDPAKRPTPVAVVTTS
jgi:hypothetical protein